MDFIKNKQGNKIAVLGAVFILFFWAMNPAIFRPLGFKVYWDVQRLAQVLFTVCITIYGLLVLAKDNNTIEKIHPAWLVIFVIGFVSTLFSGHQYHAILDWSFYLCAFASSVFLSQIISKNKNILNLIIYGISWIGFIYILNALFFAVLLLNNTQSIEKNQLYNGFNNYRFLNHTQTILIPITIWAAQLSKKRIIKSIFITSAALHFSWAIALSARATLLSLCAAFFMLCWALKQNTAKSQYIRLMLASYVIGFVLWGVIFKLAPEIMQTSSALDYEMVSRTLDKNSVLSGRGFLWLQALEMIKKNFLLGMGPMGFAALPDSPRLGTSGQHNFILQLASEWGLIVAGLIAFLFVSHIYNVKKQIGTSELLQNKLSPVYYILWAIAVDSCFSNSFIAPVSLFLIIIIFSIPIPADTYFTKYSKSLPKIAKTIAVTFVIVSLLTLSTELVSHAFCLKNCGLRSSNQFNNPYYRPRWMADGRIDRSRVVRY